MATIADVRVTNSPTSNTSLTASQIGALFPDVTPAQATTGLVDYADVYIRNIAATPLPASTIDITQETTSEDTRLELALVDENDSRPDADTFIGAGDRGAPTSVAFGAGTNLPTVSGFNGIASRGNTIWATTPTLARRLRKPNMAAVGNALSYPTGLNSAASIAVDDDNVYIGRGNSQVSIVNRTALVAGTANTFRTVTLTGVQRSNGLSIDDNNLYVGDNRNGTRRMVTFSKADLLNTANTSITRTSDRILTNNSNNIEGVAVVGNITFAVNWTSRTVTAYDSSFAVLATRSLAFQPIGVAADDTNLYVMQWQASNIHRIPLTYSGGGLPLSLSLPGNTTRRLFIKRVVDAGAATTPTDMGRVTIALA